MVLGLPKQLHVFLKYYFECCNFENTRNVPEALQVHFEEFVQFFLKA